jgi:tRNA (guanine6-N2)-methyltransferase
MNKAKGSRNQSKNSDAAQSYLLEAEVVEGLEEFAVTELGRIPSVVIVQTASSKQRRGAVRFSFRGNLRVFEHLSTVQAVYVVLTFDVPRPRGLLGDKNLRIVVNQIEEIRRFAPKDSYKTLFISAAGSDSSVMVRIKEALIGATGLVSDAEQGDLLVRIRKASDGANWEVLLRLTPRPLATKSWRVCNLEGALNATVARSMVLLSQPNPDDTYVNLGCGSGTLLIERQAWGEARHIVGVDISADNLVCAQMNIAASGRQQGIDVLQTDIRRLPVTDRSADVITADLPFGQLVGSHQENVTLYPKILDEAARIAKPQAHFVLITHELRLMTSVLRNTSDWDVYREIPITLRGLHPHIYVLIRR